MNLYVLLICSGLLVLMMICFVCLCWLRNKEMKDVVINEPVLERKISATLNSSRRNSPSSPQRLEPLKLPDKIINLDLKTAFKKQNIK